MITLSRIPSTKMFRAENCFVGKFQAMGSPCEVLVDTHDDVLAGRLFEIAVNEARRVERKWSRYVSGNIIDQINVGNGQPVRVDEETARLINFADRCTRLSEGLFDITSGIMRKAWRFNGEAYEPNRSEIEALVRLVGWDKVSWDGSFLQLQAGMEIDLGGLGKEYAVDKTVLLLRNAGPVGVLVNFGGDIAVTGPRSDGQPWTVGIEDATRDGKAVEVLKIQEGAIATSGDSRRFVMVGGKRLGHILNPRTGWPVDGAPRSVTVAAPTCTEAGFLSTLAMLNGGQAADVLKQAGVPHWCY